MVKLFIWILVKLPLKCVYIKQTVTKRIDFKRGTGYNIKYQYIGGRTQLEKLNTIQTKVRIADSLRKEILSGRIVSGEELAQEQLVKVFEVSRMPIREALQILELEGLLVRLPNRRMQVVGIKESLAYENMRLIGAVESEIALILLEKEVLPNNFDVKDDQQFHNKFSENLDNYYLKQAHKRLLNTYPKYVWDIWIGKSLLIEQNKKILIALNNRDTEAINKSIREYYCELAYLLLSHIKEKKHE